MSDDVKRALEAAAQEVVCDWDTAPPDSRAFGIETAAAAIAAFHGNMAAAYFAQGRRGLGHTHDDIAAAVERAAREAGDE